MKNALIALCLLAGACTSVDAGHVGIKIDTCDGKIFPEPLGVGMHGDGPCTLIEEYPIFQQTIIMAKSSTTYEDDRDKVDQSLNANSSEGMTFNIDATFSYTIDEHKVVALYTKYRKSIDHIERTFLRQTIKDAVQGAFSKYTAEQLYSDKKEIVRGEVFAKLSDPKGLLATDGFIAQQFTVNRWEPPKSIVEAINAKVAMVQESQRTEQEVRKKRALAEQAIVEAESRAKARQLSADAEAYANKKITDSITPTLVEYLKVQKWDGKLPQVSGTGSSTMLSLGVGK